MKRVSRKLSRRARMAAQLAGAVEADGGHHAAAEDGDRRGDHASCALAAGARGPGASSEG